MRLHETMSALQYCLDTRGVRLAHNFVQVSSSLSWVNCCQRNELWAWTNPSSRAHRDKLGIRREELLELREELIGTFEPTIESNEYLNKQGFIRELWIRILSSLNFVVGSKGD